MSLTGPVRKVVISGPGGSGKSTLARALGHNLGVPVLHLDNLYHEAGWKPRDEAVVQREWEQLAASDAWVAEGIFFTLSKPFRDHADVIVYLDFGRLSCIWNVIKRYLLHKSALHKRPDLAEGFDEAFSPSYIHWLWRWPVDKHPRWMKEMQSYGTKVVILSNRQDVKAWLKQI